MTELISGSAHPGNRIDIVFLTNNWGLPRPTTSWEVLWWDTRHQAANCQKRL